MNLLFVDFGFFLRLTNLEHNVSTRQLAFVDCRDVEDE
jgi:hypothetical protein